MTRLRNGVRLLVAAALVVAAQWVTTGVAEAAGQVCYAQEVSGVSGGISYHVRCVTASTRPGDSTGGGSDGGGTPPPDTCKLAEFQKTEAAIGTYYPAWCEGTSRCIIHDPPTESDASTVAQYAKLKPPASVIEIFCADAFLADAGGWTLAIGGVQTPRQLIVRADDAYGNLAPPPPDIHTNPGTPSVVRLATWFWLGPASFGEVRGSSADGMVAIATPRSTTWNPGDGSGAIECAGAGAPYGTGAGDCTHIYTKASFAPQPATDAKGNPAYAAVVTRTYDVRYEFYGQPVVVPGARLDFATQTTFPLAVAEVQAENN